MNYREKTEQLLGIESGELESFLQELSTVFNPIVGSDDDMLAIPAPGSTYRGVSTELGKSGSWSSSLGAESRPSSLTGTDWPHGCGSPEYNTAPGLFNYTGAWLNGNIWAQNCMRIVRRASDFIRPEGVSSKGVVFLMCMDHYDEFIEAISKVERLYYSDGLVLYEGSPIRQDGAVPEGVSYAVSPEFSYKRSHEGFLFNPSNCVQMASYTLAF